MAEISNTTLAVLVFAALVVVVAGTVLNFNAVSRYGGLTGFATEDTGTVNLTIGSTLAIAVNATFNNINFGTCTPRGGSAYWCATNDTAMCDGQTDFNCTGDTATPQYLRVDNVGNVDADVNITNNECDADTLIGGAGPLFTYLTDFCNGTRVSSWTSFVAGAQNNTVCDNISYLGGQMRLYANVTIPANAVGGSGGGCTDGQSTITFSAVVAS